jgi:hypothetical protein
MFDLAASLAKAGRRARDLTWIATILNSQEWIPAQILDSHFDRSLLTKVGLSKATTSSKKFRAEDAYKVGAAVAKGINESLAELQLEIDDLTIDLYS